MLTTGSFNIALGNVRVQTTGTNIYIGAWGLPQNDTCYIGSIWGRPPLEEPPSSLIHAGKLGTTTSSRRLKTTSNR